MHIILLFLCLPHKEKEAKRKVTAACSFAKIYVANTAAQSESFGSIDLLALTLPLLPHLLIAFQTQPG
jgi:hypothetical protein